MRKISIKYQLVLLFSLLWSVVSFGQYKGGEGDGYDGSSMSLIDLTGVPEFISVTVNQGGAQADPTNLLPVVFEVEFSEPVVDFSFDDISWVGTAGSLSGSVIGSGTSYTIEADIVGSEGTIIPVIEELKVHDVLGNTNSASTNADNSVTYDITRPGIEILREVGQSSPSNNSIISFRANFTEQVGGFVPSYINLSGTAGATTVNLRGGPLNYTIDVSGMANDGTVTVSIDEGLMNDAAGNLNTESVNTDNTIFYDISKPNVVISSVETSPTTSMQIPITINFTSQVDSFEMNDINITNCTILNFTEISAGLRWEAIVEPSTEGVVNMHVLADRAIDAAGNWNNESNNFSIEYFRGNNAPLIDNHSFAIDEWSPNGTLVGRIIASDPDDDDFVFSIVSGNINNAFELNTTTGDLTVANSEALNFFANPVFDLVIQVEDDYTHSMSSQAQVEVLLNEIENFEASNIFTPNSAFNKYWTIRNVERYVDFELSIRNNTGKIVYQTTNYNNDWNGTYNNKPLPTGTYYYFFENEAKTKLFKGFINIINE